MLPCSDDKQAGTITKKTNENLLIYSIQWQEGAPKLRVIVQNALLVEIALPPYILSLIKCKRLQKTRDY